MLKVSCLFVDVRGSDGHWGSGTPDPTSNLGRVPESVDLQGCELKGHTMATTYFDEAYFQRGEERGTAYRDYARAASISPTFREVAEAMVRIFEPRRALEIGCATGAIVRHMNELGVETHGIDVSEWAVANRLHPNVALAGAEQLPFENGVFDLVFSSHSLEHLPPASVGCAMIEFDRVLKFSGVQFHMLPLIGTYPYEGDPEAAREMLRADPTHNVLETTEWWRSRFEEAGWSPLNLHVHFYNDTGVGELTSGQMCFAKLPDRQAEKAAAWNLEVHRRLFLDLEAAKARQAVPVSVPVHLQDVRERIGGDNLPWSDFKEFFVSPIDFKEGSISLLLDSEASDPMAMRVALIDDTGPTRGVFERWLEVAPGTSIIRLNANEFSPIEGEPSMTSITSVYLGGDLRSGAVRARAVVVLLGGVEVKLFGTLRE